MFPNASREEVDLSLAVPLHHALYSGKSKEKESCGS